MRVDRSYCSNQNTWSENHPQCIVVHNTDNFAAGADARAHARAQYQGNFQIMSAHYYVDRLSGCAAQQRMLACREKLWK
jgi:N-acetylmuramoyl-L-alanine amidase CwlA